MVSGSLEWWPMMSVLWFAVPLLSLMLVLLYFFYHPEKNVSTPATPDKPEVLVAGDKLRILDAASLIRILDLSPTLANIKANLGLSDENWQKDALPMLHEYIVFVQRLPASESHHHAGDGGLVRHTLDVAALALTAAAGYGWPPHSKTEDMARLGAAWKFGILTAALLHDIGKTLTGFKVELFDRPERETGSIWLPDAGSMAQSGRTFYRVSFPEQKAAYKLHTEIAWTFFPAIVPGHVRRWLSESDPDLIIALRTYLSGQSENSPFEDIIRKADMVSTARDLKTGSRQRFAAAKRTPLIETVMETLREMLSERGRWFSIAAGAGGDLFRQGDTVYMVSKNVPDRIREFLRSNNHPAAPSFPNDNQRIFDTLLEYGAVLSNPQDEHRAVVAVDIAFRRNDGETKAQRFTMLAFRLETLYPDASSYPSEFSGSLSISQDQNSKPRGTDAGLPETADNPPETETVIPPPPRKRGDTPAVQTQEAAAQPAFMAVAADISPEKTETETGIPEETPIPSTSAKAETASATSAGGIDTLLAKHGLLEDAEDTETAPDGIPDTKSETADKPSEPENHCQVQETDVPDTPAVQSVSVVNAATPKPTQKNSMKMLKELFADQSRQAKQDMADVSLPPQESAAAGVAEIQAQRRSKPAKSPRPVSVHTQSGPDGLAETTAQLALTAVSDETAESIENIQSNPKPQDAFEDIRLRQQEDGRHFWMWLAEGLAEGSIIVNQTGATVHFTPQGMLLVTPAIFRDYAGGVFNKNDENCPGLRAQRGFTSLKLHQRSKRTALFNVETAKGSKRRLFSCYLIPEKNLYHIIRADTRPPNNPDILIAENDLLAAGLSASTPMRGEAHGTDHQTA